MSEVRAHYYIRDIDQVLIVRDMMASLLDELHEQGKLTSMSLWVELYSPISQDFRSTITTSVAVAQNESK